MKKFLKFLLVLVLCFINMKIGKCVTEFGFGQVRLYDDNQKEVDKLQRGKQYHLDFSINGIPNLVLGESAQCAVLNINLSEDLTINNKTQESIFLGCGTIMYPSLNLPLEVQSVFGVGETSANINANLFVYDNLNKVDPQTFFLTNLEVIIFNPRLSVQVQTDKEYYKQNDEIEFTININNDGYSFEDAIIEIQTNNLTNVQYIGDITNLNNRYLKLKNMESGDSKTIKIKATIKDNFDLFIYPKSLDLQLNGNTIVREHYNVYKPNVVTTNTFNLEDIQDDEEYSFKIKFTNDSVVSSGKFTSSFTLDERLELLSAESATVDGNKLTWNIDDIEAGEFVEYTIKVKKIKEIDDDVVIEPDIDYEEEKDEVKPSEDENKDDENQNNNNTNKPSNEYADKEAENPKTADQNYMIIGIVGVLLIILATIYFKVKNKKHIYKV